MTNPRLEELRAKFQENPRRYFAPYANELRKTGDPASAIAVCRTHLASQPGRHVEVPVQRADRSPTGGVVVLPPGEVGPVHQARDVEEQAVRHGAKRTG